VSLLGRVPSRGELIPHPNGIEFEVLDADPRRVKRVRLRNIPVRLSLPSPKEEGPTARRF
jgi:magnesium and cobalt transporter